MEGWSQNSWFTLNWESLLHASIHSELFPSCLPCRLQADPSALHLLLKAWSSSTSGLLGIPHAVTSLSLRGTLLDVNKVVVHLTCCFERQTVIFPMASPSKPPCSNLISGAFPCTPGLTFLARLCQVPHLLSKPVSFYLEVRKNFGAETSSQPVSSGTPFTQSCFCRWFCLFTQPGLFPQVTCLQNKGQQKKGPKLGLLYITKSPGRFFHAVTKAVLCVLCPDREPACWGRVWRI